MPRNYALEARVAEKCSAAGIVESAIQDVIERVKVGEVTDANIDEKLAEWKNDKPHYFEIQSDTMLDDALAAFGPSRTLKAQGDFIRKYGDAKASEVAARFNTKVGALKGGTIPDDLKKADDADKKRAGGPNNPWSREGWNLTRQGALFRSNPQAAASIAKAADSFIGATKPAA